MNKTAVLYKSFYGTTKKYAEWIAQEASADLFEIGRADPEQLKNYKTIVICGGLYAGGMLGKDFIKKHHEALCNKKWIVVAVGATLKSDAAVDELKAKNLPLEMRQTTPFFLLRGGMDYKKMNPLHRAMMWMMKNSLKNKKPEDLDDDAKGVLATYGKTVDFTNINAVIPIIEEINKD
jgi:menaquinone-dependent protoporphyrinogen IX oxidase